MALATFASCRSFVSLLTRLGFKDPTRNGVYESFYHCHAYYWLFFLVTVLSHAMVATLHTGLLPDGGPDAGLQRVTQVLGVGGALAGFVLFASCRTCAAFLDRSVRNGGTRRKGHVGFFSRHGFLWGALALLLAGHWLTAYRHAGIWPPLG